MALEVKGISVRVHEGDLPAAVHFDGSVAIDTETMGLNPHRDRLCLVQLRGQEGDVHLVRMPPPPADLEAPNLKALLEDPSITKIFHFARFDLVMLRRHLGVQCGPVFCTKVASRLARTYTDRHGLKDVVKELIGLDMSKEQQSSDWGHGDLSTDQLRYAAADVIHLHDLKARLEAMLVREGRMDLAAACFRFLPERAALDLAGWAGEDIFAH